MKLTEYEPKCLERHTGIWAIEPMYLKQTMDAIEAGHIKAKDVPTHLVNPRDPSDIDGQLVYDESIMVIPIMGATQKGASKYGGTSTVAVRQLLRMAQRMESVEAVLLHMDTPGGNVFGLDDLAQEIQATSAAGKPVFVQADDQLASAGVWIASVADSVSVNRSIMFGSIGAFTVLRDFSEAAEKDGVKVHVISTGELKGGADGAPITDAELAEVQKQVDLIGKQFVEVIVAGRNIDRATVEAVADGRMMTASEALELGLVDKIQSLDDTMAEIAAMVDSRREQAQARTRNAQAKIRMAKNRG